MKLARSFWYIAPSTIFLTAIGIFPLLFTVFLSFVRWNPTYSSTPVFTGLSNYVEAFTSAELGHSLTFTLTLVALTLMIESALGIGVALLLNQDNILARVTRSTILIPMVAAPVVTATLWNYLLGYSWGPVTYLLTLFGFPRLEFFKTLPGIYMTLAIVDAWQWTPFIVLIVLAGLYALPQDVYEAASLDGASSLLMMRNITLPLLKPVIAIALVLRTMDALKVFDNVWALTGGGPGTNSEVLSILLYRVGFQYFDFGYAATISILYLLTVAAIGFVLFLLFGRDFTEGLK